MKKLVNFFHIVLYFGKMTISELVSFAFGIKTTGDPDVTSPSYTDAQIQALANTVQSEIGSRSSDPRPSLTKQEQQDVDTFCRAIMAVKSDVEKVANLKAQGNRAIFEKIVRRTGFVPKDPAKKHQRVFESKPAEKGSFHVCVPSEGTGSNYVYQYGLTSAIDVPPTQWQDSISLSTTELIVNGLKSGTIVGVHYAAIDHPKHTKKTTNKLAEPDTNRAASKVLNTHAVNNKGKIVYTHGTDLLHYSDIIYIVIP
jgi:hypothetical protein